MKPVSFLGYALEALRGSPASAPQRAGYQLDRVQRGLDPDDWKPMPTVGPGVREIRVRDDAGAVRVLYLAVRKEAVYVLHRFREESMRTRGADIELGKLRFKKLKKEVR